MSDTAEPCTGNFIHPDKDYMDAKFEELFNNHLVKSKEANAKDSIEVSDNAMKALAKTYWDTSYWAFTNKMKDDYLRSIPGVN